MKPTKEQFHGYLKVQYGGKTNMYHGTRVADIARTDHNVYLLQEHISYIMEHYQELKEEFGDIKK